MIISLLFILTEKCLYTKLKKSWRTP